MFDEYQWNSSDEEQQNFPGIQINKLYKRVFVLLSLQLSFIGGFARWSRSLNDNFLKRIVKKVNRGSLPDGPFREVIVRV